MDAVEILRARAVRLDCDDPLSDHRALFDLPEGMIYLDGNSLGPPPKSVLPRLSEVAAREWGQDLITSWNRHGWMDLSRRIGARIALLIGAAPDTVRACDSTSVNILKVLSAALSLRPDRRVIVSERGNFPTDLYVAQQLIAGLGQGYELRLIDNAARDLPAALGDDVAVVMVTQVDYRTGRKLDMALVTEQAHAAGALVIWDLAHSAGAFAVDLTGARADFAVGCGYKFLNGGPGAPAFIYVAPDHQQTAQPILAGWLGHATPFSFMPDYHPAPGMDRYIVGTPPILSMSALESALDAFEGADLAAVESKTSSLGALFIEAVDMLCPPDTLTLASPREDHRRGAQVSWHHPEGYAVMQALIACGVIGDFRAPDIIRFGFAPLYLRFTDVIAAVEILAGILVRKEYRRPEYQIRAAVT